MKTTIKEMHFENYKCFPEKTISFNPGENVISGKNRAGKTTVMDGYFDIVTGKLSTGADAASDEIRTHDQEGNLVPKVNVVRSVLLDIDGREVEIKKIDEQNWVRPRGSVEEVFKGNKTRYEVDGIPMATKRQFDEWMSANIADSENLLLSSNPQYFLTKLNKSSVEARKTLEAVSGFNVNNYPGFEDARRILGGHTAEDVMKKLRKQLAEQKDKQEKKNTEIAYETGRTVEKDDSLMQVKEAAEQELSSLKAELDSADKAVKQTDALIAEIADLKWQRTNLDEKAQEERRKTILEISDTERKLKNEAFTLERDIRSLTDQNNSAVKEMSYLNDTLKNLADKWKELSATTFDEGSTICPVCGQRLPDSQIESLITDFEQKKAMQLKDIETAGSEKKKAYIGLFSQTGVVAQEKDAKRAKLKETENLLSDVQKALIDENNKPVPKPDTTEIDKDIAEKENLLSGMLEYSFKKQEIEQKVREQQKILADAEAQIAAEERQVEYKRGLLDRLKSELREIAQGAADIERDIQVLLDYSIEKNKIIAESVNKHFRHFQFKFLEFTQDGNPVEVCKLMVDGTSYNGLLNGGDRRLAEIDLCRGFQEMLGLNLPIWMDEAGTVDTWRIPKTEQQLILIRYEEGKLAVNGIEG